MGNKIIVGNPDSNLAGSTSGSVFVYDDQFGNLLTTIKNPKPNPAADFGMSLAEIGWNNEDCDRSSWNI